MANADEVLEVSPSPSKKRTTKSKKVDDDDFNSVVDTPDEPSKEDIKASKRSEALKKKRSRHSQKNRMKASDLSSLMEVPAGPSADPLYDEEYIIGDLSG